jgi:Protein ChrB, N-terminal
VVNDSEHTRWLLVVVRVPARPSRHRVAVWRELRRVGAIPLGGATWAAPAAPVFADGLAKVGELVRRADGTMLTLDAAPHAQADAEALLAEFNAARAAEWRER